MPAVYRRRRPFSAAVVLVVVLLLAARFYLAEPPAAEPPPLVEGDYVVRRVVDGDTLLMTDGVRVRLIGVDTPETVKPDAPVEPWGKEAAEFTRNFVAGGNVRLRFDRERLDDFGRTLAYVYVGEAMLNEELIRAGLSPARTRFRYAPAMKKRFRTAEDEARRAGRGIWSDKQP
ncbi:MAG: thermonuclease [Planctomycetota bacterium]|nr:MAG: thermonuclease [Planctomycetota bacterium]